MINSEIILIFSALATAFMTGAVIGVNLTNRWWKKTADKYIQEAFDKMLQDEIAKKYISNMRK